MNFIVSPSFSFFEVGRRLLTERQGRSVWSQPSSLPDLPTCMTPFHIYPGLIHFLGYPTHSHPTTISVQSLCYSVSHLAHIQGPRASIATMSSHAAYRSANQRYHTPPAYSQESDKLRDRTSPVKTGHLYSVASPVNRQYPLSLLSHGCRYPLQNSQHQAPRWCLDCLLRLR